MRQLLRVFALSIALGAPVHPAPAATGPTWRLDYFHTGGLGVEIFSVDRVVVEPLPWPGPADRALDTTGSGVYRFELSNEQGELLYSRGFSSIYGEWVTTAEAGKVHRTFHESLRFPAPAVPVDLVVQKRNAGNKFETVWTTHIDPADMFVDRSTPPRQELIRLEQHGEPAAKVDLLLLGDGYTAAECAEKFRADALRMTAALFEHEPFHTHRQDFNVWGLCPPSPASGVSRPSTGIHIASPAGASYDAFGSERYVLTYQNRALRDIAAWAPYEALAILVNSETYGGGGIFNLYTTVAVDNDWADYIFVHEFGHHFAALADEYYTSPVAYEPVTDEVEPWEKNVTALHDPATLKWRELLTPGAPLPTPWPKQVFEERQRQYQSERQRLRDERRPESEMSALFRRERDFETGLFSRAEYRSAVGAFQGANYNAEAFYRPALDCVMFSRNGVPFCPVCKRALEEVIDLYAPR